MKTKTALATFLFAGSMIMLFAAAKVQTCEEKFKSCTMVCDGELQKCKLSGRPDETCEQIHRSCVHTCQTDRAECEKTQKK